MPACAVCDATVDRLAAMQCPECDQVYCRDHYHGHDCDPAPAPSPPVDEDSSTSTSDGMPGWVTTLGTFLLVSSPTLFLLLWTIDAPLVLGRDVFVIAAIQLILLLVHFAIAD